MTKLTKSQQAAIVRTVQAIDGSAPRGGAIPNAPETESGCRGSGGRTIVKSADRIRKALPGQVEAFKA